MTLWTFDNSTLIRLGIAKKDWPRVCELAAVRVPLWYRLGCVALALVGVAGLYFVATGRLTDALGMTASKGAQAAVQGFFWVAVMAGTVLALRMLMKRCDWALMEAAAEMGYGLCGSCGYVREGLRPADRCPECGSEARKKRDAE